MGKVIGYSPAFVDSSQSPDLTITKLQQAMIRYDYFYLGVSVKVGPDLAIFHEFWQF